MHADSVLCAICGTLTGNMEHSAVHQGRDNTAAEGTIYELMSARRGL